jgi:hypothetical protein
MVTRKRLREKPRLATEPSMTKDARTAVERLRLLPDQLSARSDVEYREMLTFDTNEDGGRELANEMLSRVEKAFCVKNRDGLGFTTQINIGEPVAQSPVTDSLIGGARPTRPYGARRLVVVTVSPLHVRESTPSDSKYGDRSKREEGEEDEGDGVAAAQKGP